MQTTFALLSVALAAAGASAQGVAAGTLLPSTSTPSTCSENYSGKFEITVVKAGASKRQSSSCSSSDVLVAQLSGGILTDAKGRIGGIVANHQFQFDGPPSQTGTLINGGWSVCNNGSLALGASSVFYQCLSGDFYNLYDESTGAQCQQVLIDIIPCSSSSTASVASQVSDGQVTAASAATQISDGQIQASSAATVVSQITDGQIQAQSAAYQPVSQISDGQIQATAMATATPVKQITDGQIQATTAAANTATPVKQITDGQIQATTAAVVSQISDGQIQATAAATLKTTASPVAQISDGQIQASNATAKATTAATYTGGAALPTFAAGAFAAVAAVGAALL